MKHFTRIEPTIVQEVGNKYKRQVVIKNFQTDDGKVHEFTTFLAEGIHAGDVVAVTSDKQVITVYQFRAGPEKWVYDIPGGGFKKGQDFQVEAVRELLEETGYVPGNVESLGESAYDNYSNMLGHYYLATDCVLSDDGTRRDQEEQDQGQEVCLISIDEFIDHAKQNRMGDPRAVLMAYDRLMELKEGKRG